MLNTSKTSIRECIQFIVMEIPLLYAPTSLPLVPLNLEVKGVPYLANNQWLKVMVICLAIMAIHYTSKMHTQHPQVLILILKSPWERKCGMFPQKAGSLLKTFHHLLGILFSFCSCIILDQTCLCILRSSTVFLMPTSCFPRHPLFKLHPFWWNTSLHVISTVNLNSHLILKALPLGTIRLVSTVTSFPGTKGNLTCLCPS